MKTWHFEIATVTIVMVVIAAAKGSWLELVGAGAVVASFGHAQVAERLRERDAARITPAVPCNVWSTRYFVAKEVMWAAYFAVSGSYAALAGVGVFLVYPAWRRLWRKWYPLCDDSHS